ncbi:polymorphic toxin type 44 domain-containing protein, partial [Nocardia gipuzkoensis]
RSVIADAEAAGFTVTQDLTVANAPGRETTPDSERARGDWQQQLTHAVTEVAAQDGRLQQELSTLRAAMRATFDAVAHSRTSVDETRFADSEQYIFDEMKRNINSDTVKDIQALLRKPQWYDFGRDYGGDIEAALVMWGLKVAPDQDWDHKPKLKQRFGLRKKDDFFFRQPGTDRKVFYDIYSNMHYGYVGRAAGFDADTLIKGASLGESALTGKDDEGDQITMRAGIELYD